MFVGSKYNRINKVCEQPVLINNTSVSRTNTQKCLGVEIDEKLSWEKHIDTICKKISAGIGAITGGFRGALEDVRDHPPFSVTHVAFLLLVLTIITESEKRNTLD